MKGWSISQIKADFDETLAEASPSTSTISKWLRNFKRGETSTKDAPCPERENFVVTEENIEKVHRLVNSDRKLKVREIAKALNISKSSVYKILQRYS